MASQPVAEIAAMEQIGQIGQRVQMLLEFARRHEKWRVLQIFDTNPMSLVSIH